MSFFRNVFSSATSKQAPSASPTDQADSIDSMFAGLSFKPRVPEPAQSSPDPTDQATMAEPEPQPSAFSFVQSSSAFSFIVEEPLQRSSSGVVSDLNVNEGDLAQALYRRHASEPVTATSDISRGYHRMEANNGNIDAISHDNEDIIDPIMENYTSILEKTPSEPDVSPNPHLTLGVSISIDTPEHGSDRWQTEMQKFANILSDLMINHWKFITVCNESQSNFENDYKSLLRSLSEASGDVEALKVSQLKAVEDEAYDRADELDSKIQQLQGDIEDIKDRIKVVNGSKLEIIHRRQLQIKQLQISVEEVLSDLMKLKDCCYKEGQEIITSSLSQLQNKEEHLKEDSERISKIIDIINDDLDRVQNEHDGVRSAIRERTKDAQGEKDSICSELQAIDEELTRLKEQIRLKEKEQARLQEVLSDIDQKISLAGASFDRQLMRIENQRLRIEADRGDILKEQEELALSESRIRSEKQRIADLEHSASKFSEIIDQIISDREQQLVSVLDTVHICDQAHERIQALEQAWEEAQLRLAEQDRKARLLSSQQISIEEDIKKHEAHINEADQQLPDLEDQKTNAVSSRDFKSAGILAKQLKQLAASKSDSVESIEKLKNDLFIVNGSVLDHEASLREARLQFEAADQQLDRLKFEHIQEQMMSLLMSKVAASSEELGIIEAHIDQLTASAETIGQKHSWELKRTIAEPSTPRSCSPSPSSCLDSPRSCSVPSRSSPHVSPSKASDDNVLPANGLNENDNGLASPKRLAEIVMAIKSLEEKLQKAIDSDDYDQADHIQIDIDKLNSEKDTIQAVLKKQNSEREEAAVVDRDVAEDDPSIRDISCEESEYDQECDDGRRLFVSPGSQPVPQPDGNVKEGLELSGHTDE